MSLYIHMLFYWRTNFSKSVDTDGYQFFEGDQVFIIWEWEWLEDDSNSECQQSDSNQESNNENDGISNTRLNKGMIYKSSFEKRQKIHLM